MNLSSSPNSHKPVPSVDIKPILALVEADMQVVNRTIADNLSSQIALINQLGGYIVQAGGKRLRPVALLLAAKACVPEQTAAHQQQTLLAAIIEFIHTATLLHDDVVDESQMRRGHETANEVFGNAASVLVGDYVYSRSFQMMVQVNNMQVMEIISRTTNQIAEGEVMQLINCGSADTSEAQYMATIQSKTAILFEAATQLAAVITQQTEAVENALAVYGRHLGTAFQLVDDILDYTAQATTMGKNVGDDLAEGKPTLPLIHAIEHSSQHDKQLLVDAITDASIENLEAVLTIIKQTDSLNYTANIARQQAQLAQSSLAVLPDSVYKKALFDLADFAVERAY